MSSYLIIFAFILTVSSYKIVNVSAFTPLRAVTTSHGITTKTNTTNYEIISAEREPVIREKDDDDGDDDDETSQEDSSSSVGDDDDNENESEESGETNDFDDRNCTCSRSGCLCCINLNLSFIDLGGPGCVKFSYIPNNDTLAVNMSYGERLLESSTIKRGSPEPTCMDLFSDLAQMCAKFTPLSRVAKGVKGCVSVEPILLGVSQTSYDVGCFNMDVEGVQPQIIPTTNSPVTPSNNVTKDTTDKPDESEEEELAAAISQSAEEGIAWFNNLISSVFGEELNETSTTESVAADHTRNKTQTVKLPTS